MGIEYTISVPKSTASRLDAILKEIPEFSDSVGADPRYEFRADKTTSGMPDAHASIGDDGVYFCDNGGEGSRILQTLLARLRAAYGDVAIEEL